MLIDGYGRPLTRLRLKVTNRCNFRCFFCHREGFEHDHEVLTPEDYGFLASVARELEIRRFKITGGEPLVRSDIVNVVKAIVENNEPLDVSLTTNGYLLDRYAESLRRAGLHRLNVSLHTLDSRKFKMITGVDGLERVVENVKMVASMGFREVKVNMVVMRLNCTEIPDMIRFAQSFGITLQLVELMPLGNGASAFGGQHVDLGPIVEWLKRVGEEVGVREDLHNRPVFKVGGIKVEIVKNVENPSFCRACAQLRIMSDGTVKTCMYVDPSISLLDAIKRRDRKRLIELIRLANSLRRPLRLT